MIKENFIKLYETSFRENWDLPSVSDYGTDQVFFFCDVAEEVARLHIVLEQCGVKKGDKVALVGKDCARWCIAYMATITYGAVIVPILQDFNPNDIHHIINHSESVVLFVSDRIWDTLEEEKIPDVQVAFSLTDFHCILRREGMPSRLRREDVDALMVRKYPAGFTKEDIRYAEVGNEELIEINYTSGTTGFSKGVMLTGNNLAGNVTYAQTLNLMFRGDDELCFLPLAHAYSCAFNLLTPMAIGAHVHILGKLPSPKVLLKAFQDVRPNLIITVPLILEKIYKNVILPQLNKRSMKMALSIPLLANRIYSQINKRLTDTLGGQFCEVIVGGAAMSQEVTDFLCKIKFPVTVGYGMTECGPLISYEQWDTYKEGSVGRIVDRMEVKIDSPDPENVAGEIMVRGTNVMLGYYKNAASMSEVMAADGWMLTGDLGTMDKDGFLFIRGRSKTMILSSNGQNIYPEEIESVLNNLPYVGESLIVSYGDKLAALIYPDNELVAKNGLTDEELNAVMKENLTTLNEHIPKYCKIEEFRLRTEAFEKTPKQSIKRYLYQEKT